MGWTQSGLRFGNSTKKDDYTWEGGQFNGGEFGNANWLGTNSTWYDGQFNGGEFKGRLWNNGVFTYGNFNGFMGLTAHGGFNYESYTYSYVSQFSNYFTQDFYGLWVDGVVTNKVDYQIDSKWNSTNFSNMLWLNGTFSSDIATMENSLFLDGSFSKGNFRKYISKKYKANRIGELPPLLNEIDPLALMEQPPPPLQGVQPAIELYAPADDNGTTDPGEDGFSNGT